MYADPKHKKSGVFVISLHPPTTTCPPSKAVIHRVKPKYDA